MADVRLTITGQNLSKQAIDQLKKDLEETTRKLNEVSQGNVKVDDTSKKAQAGLLMVAGGLGAISAAGVLMLRSTIGAATRLERMKLALVAVAGSTERANAQFRDLIELAKMPGLGLPEVSKAVTSLQALDVSFEDSKRIVREWGNEIVKMGGGRDNLDRVIVQLTQIMGKTSGWGQDIRQIAESMPSIRKHMIAAFGTATSEEFAKMGITAQKFIKGITDELAKQSRVAGGTQNSIDNLRDSWFQMQAMLGEILLPTFQKVLDSLAKMVEYVKNLSATQREIIAWGTVSVTALAAIGAAVAGLTFTIAKLKVMIGALAGTWAWFAAHPAGAAAIAIAAVAGALVSLYMKSQDTTTRVNKLGKAIDSTKASADKLKKMEGLINEIEKLRGKTELTTEEHGKLKDAQSELIKLSPEFVAKFDKEGNAIALATDKLKEHIDKLKEMHGIERMERERLAMEEIAKIEDKINKKKADRQKLEANLTKASEKRLKGEKVVFEPSFDWAGYIGTPEGAIKYFSKEMDKIDEETKALEEQLKQVRELVKSFKVISAEPFGPPEPRPAYQPTKEEEAAFADLQKAQAEAIEDTYRRRIALANLTFAEETKGHKEARESIIANAQTEEERKAKLDALDAKYQAAKIRRDIAIRDAERDRQEAIQKVINDTLDKEQQRIEDLRNRREEAIAERERRQEEAFRKDLERIGRHNEFEAEQTQQQLDKSESIRGDADDRRQKETKEFYEFLERIEEAKRTEEKKTFNAYYQAEEARISLIQNNRERELEQIRLQYETRVKYIEDELNSENISYERKVELERQLDYLKKKYISDRWAVVNRAIEMETQKTFNAYYQAEEMRIGLIIDNRQREIEQTRLKYETNKKYIEAELAEEEISYERRMELERQLAYLREQYTRDVTTIQNRTRDELLRTTSDTIAALPSGLARALWEARSLHERYADDIKALNEETAREINRINSDYAKSAAQRHREIERLEKESAQRRLEIEKQLDAERRAIYTDFIKNFFMKLLSSLETRATDMLSDAIFKFLKNRFAEQDQDQGIDVAGIGIGLATGNPWPAVAALAQPMLSGIIFDNPANDALARDYGRQSALLYGASFDNPINDTLAKDFGKHAAALYGASFDNPINDFNAKLMGTRTAAYSLGRRSADDMLSNFTQGFAEGARTRGETAKDSEIAELLKELKHALQNPAAFKLNIDGRELHSTIARLDDKIRARGSGY